MSLAIIQYGYEVKFGLHKMWGGLAKEQKLTSKLLHYTTSADYSHDSSSVVGYMSVLFFRDGTVRTR